jgi:hypothetical protein
VAAKGVRRLTERFVPQKAMAYAEGFYERHGPQALFLARFLPAVRTEMTFVAGYTRMPYRRFLFWDLLAIAVWLPALTVLGVIFSESVTALLSSYTRLVTVGLWIVLTAAAGFIVYKFVTWRRGKVPGGEGHSTGDRGADERDVGDRRADEPDAGDRGAEERNAGDGDGEHRHAGDRGAEKRDADDRGAEDRQVEERTADVSEEGTADPEHSNGDERYATGLHYAEE